MASDGSGKGKLGFWQAAAIGVGGMVGGGIFAVLGLAAEMGRGGTPVAFLLAGIVALLTAASYAALSRVMPDRGGTVQYLNQAFGTGLATGTLNLLLWLSYIVMLALYARAFGTYGALFFGEREPGAWTHLLLSAALLGIGGLNLAGADFVGRAEGWLVGIKLVLLLILAGAGLVTMQSAPLALSNWAAPLPLLAGGMIIFLAYEGFELIANASADAAEPEKTIPRALYGSVIFVTLLYCVIAAVTVGNLSLDTIRSASEYVLAEVARPSFGDVGFKIVALTAVLSTASAINATLYGAARLSYSIAKSGELPDELTRKIWNKPVEGLLLTVAMTLLVANLADLSSISLMGSAGFLIVFAVVNLADWKLADRTGSPRWRSLLAAAACALALLAMLWQVGRDDPVKLSFLAALIGLSFGIEAGYRLATGRTIRLPPVLDGS